MEFSRLPEQQARLGWHYFQDALHYREIDLLHWLPELQSMGASWLTLYTPQAYAIPESFITGLLNANIQPILHFQLSSKKPLSTSNLKALLNVYSKWGVRYVMFFDRPNQMQSWHPAAWAQDKLVERFLDAYLPNAELSLSYNLTPILPPLEPGGDYWDTAFLYDLLTGISRRGHSSLLDRIVLGASARAGNRPLNWGVGGPESWPLAQPYNTPEGSQDQRGFRTFDWYSAVANAVLGKVVPIILFNASCTIGDHRDNRFAEVSIETHTRRNMEIAQDLAGEDSGREPIPPEVIACNFSPLVPTPGSTEAAHAWYPEGGDALPVVKAMKVWASAYHRTSINKKPWGGINNPHPIAHYLLVTQDLWTTPGMLSKSLQDFLQKFKPTMGFSAEDAAFARRVTIYGRPESFPPSIVDQLVSAGCLVEWIQQDGTIVAS